jgi:hypothetical protein
VKRPGEQCPHLNPKAGCRIYNRRPWGCRWWSCTWLIDRNVPIELRPDAVHVVVDMVSDTVISDEVSRPVVQFWNDVRYPDAWKDSAILDLMEFYGTKGLASLVRFNNDSAIYIEPPTFSGQADWLIKPSNNTATRAEFDEHLRALAAASGEPTK